MPIRFILIFLLWILSLSAVADTLSVRDTEVLPADKERLREAAFHYLYHGNTALARKYGQRLLELGELQNDRVCGQLYGHLILGLVNTESRLSTEGYTHLETARALAMQYHNHEALMLILNGFGNYAMFAYDDIYTAISYYFQALDEAKYTGNRRQYAMILSNISGAYFMRNDFSGLVYAEEAVDIAHKIKEPIPLFYGTMNTALYYLASDSLRPARMAIEAVCQMHTTQGFGTKSDICLLQAMLYAKYGETDKAYGFYSQAMENFPTTSASTITIVYLEYARLLRADNRVKNAIKVLEYALGHVDDSGIPIHKRRLLKELALCYREAGQTGKALECTLEYMGYQDRLFDEVRERATQEARIKHDIYSREQQISEQQLVILNNRYRTVVLTCILAAVFVALGLICFFYRKKIQLYNAIVSQNRECLHREKMLLAQMDKMRQDGQASVALTNKLNDLMSRFTTLMIEEQLFTDPSLTVGSMADRLGTNRTYLSKAINETTGKSFTQLVNEYRIRQAIVEISDLAANKPLKQIAAEVGFSSLSTFYTCFQSGTGMTPACYRSQLKGM